jgi:hypothetical protein
LRPVEHNAVVSISNQPSHHVGAHTAKTYHSKLHKLSYAEIAGVRLINVLPA